MITDNKNLQPEIGLSAFHSLDNVSKPLFDNIIQNLAEIEFDYFEIFRSDSENWIQYPVLTQLNNYKKYNPEQLAAIRDGLAKLKSKGKSTGIWFHDIFFSGDTDLLAIYPELKTPKGDLNLSHPLLHEFLVKRLETFFKALPEMDRVVLTMTETTYPVMHRFDNEMPPQQCIEWLLGIYRDCCNEYGKELIVRPFSANKEDYKLVNNALDNIVPDAPVMLKSDPYDWNPFLGISPYFADYKTRPVIMELDLAGEYFGRNFVPAVALEYLQERMEHGKDNNVSRYVGRIDRRGFFALGNCNSANVFYFSDYFNNNTTANNPDQFMGNFVNEHYPAAQDPQVLSQALQSSFEVIKKTFYVGGQLLFHVYFSDLEQGINNLIFESFRSDHPLGHTANEWSFISDKKTLSYAEALKEKEDAVAEAENILKTVLKEAGGYPDLVEMSESLVLLTKLYLVLTKLSQAYLKKCDNCADSLQDELDEYNKVVNEIINKRGKIWMPHNVYTEENSIVSLAQSFAEDLCHTFEEEKRLSRQYVKSENNLEDRVFCGMPGEGHFVGKYSHGAKPVKEGPRWHRKLRHYLEYTLDSSIGNKELELELKGSGRVLLDNKQIFEFNNSSWSLEKRQVELANNKTKVRVEKTGMPEPEIRLIAIYNV
ncbi:MAG: hypothetical protein ACYTFY_13760 [Planctomycetota bacterium]|jgi:hypothetical protein